MAAFVSFTTGAASRSVTVPAGTDRLLVAIALSSDSVGARSATYDGVAMQVASTANGWVQIFYMLNPTAGAATLAVTGTDVSTVIAAHYTGIGGFQAASQGSVASASFSPSWGGLIVFGMVAASASHTPLAGTTERLDGGDYFADRIVTGSGSVNVGVSSATDPDYAGAIFLDSVLVSGTPSAPVATATGSATVVVAASGTPTAPAPSASGSANINVVSVSGSVSALLPSVGGLAEVVVSVSGSISAPSPDVTEGRVSAATHTHAEVTLVRASSSVTAREPAALLSLPRAQGSASEN